MTSLKEVCILLCFFMAFPPPLVAQLPLIPPNIAMITGPTMLGICLNWGFMGVLVAQTFFYHVNFPQDTVGIKFLVYGVVILDLLQTGLVTADAFHWFVFGFGNMIQLDETFLNSWDVPLLDSVIALIVQCFYSWRIYLLRKSILLSALIVTISLCQFGAGIAVAVIAHRLGKLSLIPTQVAEQATWLVASAVADILITGILSWTLLRSRSKHLPVSSRRLSRLVVLIVETNCLTAGCAVISLILFLGVPQHATLVVPPTAIIGKLYTNCLLAVLNNRKIDTVAHAGSGSTAITNASISFYSVRVSSEIPTTSKRGHALQVQVIRNIETCDDSGKELDDLESKARSRIGNV